MQFGSPSSFYLLLLVPLLGALLWWARQRRRRLEARFGDPALMAKLTASVSPVRDRIKTALLLAAVFFLVLALARPQWGHKTEQVVRSGVDVFLALDTSLSMDATDVVPSRIGKAQHIASALMDRLQGNRIGLIVFSGSAFVQCPLTLDYGAAQIFLDSVFSGIVPEPGTNIAEALEAARRSFVSKESKYKVVVLLTDGEQHEGDPVRAARQAREEGIVIHAVGIGTPGGDPIPVRDERGRVVEYLRDEGGQPVLSRLDEDTLGRIALTTGGKYFRASRRESEVEEIASLVSEMESKELDAKLFTSYEERFYWPLGLAIAFLTAETVIPRRRSLAKGPRRGETA
ncbi:MAG: VWA domain-containing protein [Acidobacteriota bacterium]